MQIMYINRNKPWLYERDSNAEVNAANLTPNSEKNAYGVEGIARLVYNGVEFLTWFAKYTR